MNLLRQIQSYRAESINHVINWHAVLWPGDGEARCRREMLVHVAERGDNISQF
jgi:hypothetical protein